MYVVERRSGLRGQTINLDSLRHFYLGLFLSLSKSIIRSVLGILRLENYFDRQSSLLVHVQLQITRFKGMRFPDGNLLYYIYYLGFYFVILQKRLSLYVDCFLRRTSKF